MYPGRILLPAILINPDTGSQLGQEVQLTNKIGHEFPKHVLPTDDGGFKILYQAGDMALNENGSYVGRDKSILATYDQNLNLIEENIGDLEITTSQYSEMLSENVFAYRYTNPEDGGDSSIAIHNFSTDVNSIIDCSGPKFWF